MHMKLSARNQFKGKVVDVTRGATTSHVRIDIGQGVIITSSITNEAVADLDLKKGDEAWAVIKASDVMIGK
jgi:molybdopterin-binding protein